MGSGWLDDIGDNPETVEAVMPGSNDLLARMEDVTQVRAVRMFDTGATRDTDQGKLDYEGFLSPLVLQRFAEYMDKHRVQADGSLRDSDNWQKGIPLDAYMKSMWRHFMSVWMGHRYGLPEEEALCALLFNVQGYLHELIKARRPLLQRTVETPAETQSAGHSTQE